MPMPRKKNCPDVEVLRRLAKTEKLVGLQRYYGVSQFTLTRWLDEYQIMVPASNFLPIQRPSLHVTKDWCRGCFREIPYREDVPSNQRFCGKARCQERKKYAEAKDMLRELKLEIRRQALRRPA